MESYHQLIPDSLKQKLGRFVFGVADVSPVEYTPVPVLKGELKVVPNRWDDMGTYLGNES